VVAEMWWEEGEVEATLNDFLVNAGWAAKEKPRRVRADIFASREFRGLEHTLIMEVKGDVVNPAYDPSAYRNKYMQIILGQLLCRTGPDQCGYDGTTILGIGVPDPCKDGSHFFVDYFARRLATPIREMLRLCVFKVDEAHEVTMEVPSTVAAGLFR
jgi:hypothetical protein